MITKKPLRISILLLLPVVFFNLRVCQDQCLTFDVLSLSIKNVKSTWNWSITRGHNSLMRRCVDRDRTGTRVSIEKEKWLEASFTAFLHNIFPLWADLMFQIRE